MYIYISVCVCEFVGAYIYTRICVCSYIYMYIYTWLLYLLCWRRGAGRGRRAYSGSSTRPRSSAMAASRRATRRTEHVSAGEMRPRANHISLTSGSTLNFLAIHTWSILQSLAFCWARLWDKRVTVEALWF